MNKVEVGLLIATIGIIFFIGGIVYYEMADQMEIYKDEIHEIGPPCITNIWPMVAMVLVTAVVLEVVLWLSKRGKNLDER